MQQNSTISPRSAEAVPELPAHLIEYFERLQAAYRSNGIHTPEEWPMNTHEGREAYRKSMEREAFLKRLNGAKEAIERADVKLSSMPFGSKIDFDRLLYGEEVQ